MNTPGPSDANSPGGNENRQAARSRSVTFLSFGVLIIAVFFWLRLIQAIQLRAFIEELAPGVSPAYLMATGLVFGTAGLPVAWGLWSGKHWAGTAARRYAFALAAYYWLDFAFIVASDSARSAWPFAVAFTVLGLAWVVWALGRPANKAYFNRRSTEDTSRNSSAQS